MKRTIVRGAVLGAVVVNLFATSPALAQPAPIGSAAAATLEKWKFGERYGFGGQRKSIAKFSPAEQKELADLIREYTTMNNGENVTIHVNAPHDVHMAPYSLFFPWHNTYIKNLETWLTSKGKSKYVPLPKYIPAKGNPIPKVLTLDAKGKSMVSNLEPANLQEWIDAGLTSDKLKQFAYDLRPTKDGKPDETIPDSQVLSDIAIWPHNDTHNIVGGTMASMRSPSVPIFWLYHAFIDDIQYDWAQQKRAGKVAAAVPPAELPLAKQVRTTKMKVSIEDGQVVLESTTTGDKYMVVRDGTSFDVLGDILRDGVGKELVVQGRFNEDDKTVRLRRVDIEKPMAGPGGTVDVFNAAGAKVGQIGEVSAVRVVGLSPDGKSFKVIYGYKEGFGLQLGFVPRSSLPLVNEGGHHHDHGAMPATPPSTTPGMNGALGGGMNHDHH